MTSNTGIGQSIPQVLSQLLKTRVKSKAITGARHIYNLPITGALGLNISKQYRSGPWDWVVINGGGNDLWLGCGCGPCTRRLDRMISTDGKNGVIPALVTKVRRSGARVIYVGYLRSPGRGSPIEGCRAVGDKLDQRISQMAKLDRGVSFLPMSNLVPHGDRSFHAADMIHPSAKGSHAVAQRIARKIR